MIIAAGTHIYAWQPNGKPRRTASRSPRNPAFCAPALESDISHPKCGFLATPGVAHLEGFTEAPGHRRAEPRRPSLRLEPNGKPVKGYPVALVDPAEAAAGHAHDRRVDQRAGDRRPRRLRPRRRRRRQQRGLRRRANGEDVSFAGRHRRRRRLERPPVRDRRRDGKIMPGWPVKMPGLIQDMLPLIGPGQDAAIAKIGGRNRDRRLGDRRRAARSSARPGRPCARSSRSGRRRSAPPRTRPTGPAR